MENLSSTTELLHEYYQGFAQKQGWQSVLSEDFLDFPASVSLIPLYGI